MFNGKTFGLASLKLDFGFTSMPSTVAPYLIFMSFTSENAVNKFSFPTKSVCKCRYTPDVENACFVDVEHGLGR